MNDLEWMNLYNDAKAIMHRLDALLDEAEETIIAGAQKAA